MPEGFGAASGHLRYPLAAPQLIFCSLNRWSSIRLGVKKVTHSGAEGERERERGWERGEGEVVETYSDSHF